MDYSKVNNIKVDGNNNIIIVDASGNQIDIVNVLSDFEKVKHLMNELSASLRTSFIQQIALINNIFGVKPQNFGALFPLDHNFITIRKNELSNLLDCLENNQIVAVFGKIGSGKSYLLSHVFKNFRYQYDHVGWFNYNHSLFHTLVEQYTASYFELNANDNEIYRKSVIILNEINNRYGKKLIIISNINKSLSNNEIDFLSYFTNSRIIISVSEECKQFTTIHCKPLSAQQIKGLLDSVSNASLLPVDFLHKIEPNAFCISLLSKSLENDDIKTAQKKLGALIKFLANEKSENKVTAFIVAVYNTFPLSAAERWLLIQFVALPIQFYDIDDLKNCFQMAEDSINLSEIESFSAYVSKFENGIETRCNLVQLLSKLLNSGWIEKYDDYYKLNQIVSESVKDKLNIKPSDIQEIIGSVFSSYYLNDIGEQYFNLPIKEIPEAQKTAVFIAYASRVLELIQLSDYNHEVLDLAYKLVSSFFEQHDFDLSRKYCELCLAHIEKIEPNSIYHANFIFKLSRIYHKYGNFVKVIELLKDCLPIYTRYYGDNSFFEGVIYSEIGIAYSKTEQHWDALIFKKKALEIMENHTDSLNLCVLLDNLAVSLINLYQLDEALKVQIRALDLCMGISDLEISREVIDYHQAQILGNLSNTYTELQDYERALEYGHKSIAIYLSILEPNHFAIGISYDNLGGIYHFLLDYNKAIEYRLKSLAILELILPPKHPDLIKLYKNIMDTYIDMNQPENAKPFELKFMA